MATKKIESFKSSKFDLKIDTVIGGYLPTTYGDYYGTTNGRYDPSGTADEARTTFNKQGLQQPNKGEDDFMWCG